MALMYDDEDAASEWGRQGRRRARSEIVSSGFRIDEKAYLNREEKMICYRLLTFGTIRASPGRLAYAFAGINIVASMS